MRPCYIPMAPSVVYIAARTVLQRHELPADPQQAVAAGSLVGPLSDRPPHFRRV
jgi:hypothetical protein